jgi:hypothetical protein
MLTTTTKPPKNIYVPENFQVGCDRLAGMNKYRVRYNNLEFSVLDNKTSHCPTTWVLEIDRKVLHKEGFWIVGIFYENSGTCITNKNIHEDKLCSLDVAIRRTMQVFGSDWREEMNFGVWMFYQWVRCFYQPCHETIPFIELFESTIETDENEESNEFPFDQNELDGQIAFRGPIVINPLG